jgi:hypothetical protein
MSIGKVSRTNPSDEIYAVDGTTIKVAEVIKEISLDRMMEKEREKPKNALVAVVLKEIMARLYVRKREFEQIRRAAHFQWSILYPRRNKQSRIGMKWLLRNGLVIRISFPKERYLFGVSRRGMEFVNYVLGLEITIPATKNETPAPISIPLSPHAQRKLSP